MRKTFLEKLYLFKELYNFLNTEKLKMFFMKLVNYRYYKKIKGSILNDKLIIFFNNEK